jgi:exosortase A-associated hydrolase 2
MEKQIFFKNKSGHKLFGVLFTPDGEPKAKGVIICQPIADERYRAKRILVNQARLLCHNGCHVLIFDYFGEGDSEGNFEETSATTRVSDICDGIQFLKEASGVTDIGILGLRMGASLALLALQQTDLSFCVLWEPIIDGYAYMQNWLRVNLSSQLVYYKEIKYNRKALEDQLLKGARIENEGYVITKDFYTSFAQINLLNITFLRIPALIIEISLFPKTASQQIKNILRENNHDNCSYLLVKESKFWESLKIYNPNPIELLNSTFNFIIRSRGNH